MENWIIVYNKRGKITNSAPVNKNFALHLMNKFIDAVYVEKIDGRWKRKLYKGMIPFWETLISF